MTALLVGADSVVRRMKCGGGPPRLQGARQPHAEHARASFSRRSARPGGVRLEGGHLADVRLGRVGAAVEHVGLIERPAVELPVASSRAGLMQGTGLAPLAATTAPKRTVSVGSAAVRRNASPILRSRAISRPG